MSSSSWYVILRDSGSINKYSQVFSEISYLCLYPEGFSINCFSVSGFTLRFSIQFELFVQKDKDLISFCGWIYSFAHTLYWKVYLFLDHGFALLLNIRFAVWVYLWVVSLIHVSVACARIMFSLSLLFCSVVWGQIIRCSWQFSFCLKLFWVSGLFVLPMSVSISSSCV